ncbi:MAG: hypothetical protein R3E85_07595 [Planctomycetota bacterium]
MANREDLSLQGSDARVKVSLLKLGVVDAEVVAELRDHEAVETEQIAALADEIVGASHRAPAQVTRQSSGKNDDAPDRETERVEGSDREPLRDRGSVRSCVVVAPVVMDTAEAARVLSSSPWARM